MNSKPKTIHVLGCAPSVQDFKPDGNETIGVNDIFKYHKVDNLVILDKSKSFTADRLKTIIESEPKRFYSTLPEWKRFFPEMKKLNIQHRPGDVTLIDNKKLIIHHVDSTITAVHLAYKRKATNIIMHGVDFTGEKWAVHENAIFRVYADLLCVLRDKGIQLSVSNTNSLLAQILPII